MSSANQKSCYFQMWKFLEYKMKDVLTLLPAEFEMSTIS